MLFSEAPVGTQNNKETVREVITHTLVKNIHGPKTFLLTDEEAYIV